VTIRQNGFIGYSLASGLHCNGWCCENLSLGSFYIKLEERRKVRRYDTTRPWGSTQLRGSRTERVRPDVRKDRVWICIVWLEEMEMRWCLSTPGSAEYILPVTLSTSVTPVSPYNGRRSLKMYLIEHVWDALGDRDRMNSEMHLEAEIEWTQKMHLEAVIDRVWRCTLRLWPSEFGDALAGYDRARLEEYLEAVDLEGGTTAAEILFIGELVIGWETGWERETVDLGMTLYLVYPVLCVNSSLWHGEIERDDLNSCS